LAGFPSRQQGTVEHLARLGAQPLGFRVQPVDFINARRVHR
jgi:hypothetical protein